MKYRIKALTKDCKGCELNKESICTFGNSKAPKKLADGKGKIRNCNLIKK